MPNLDLQPVDLRAGIRIYPNTLIKIRVATDKSLPENERSAVAEKNYRTAFKTTEVELKDAECKEARHYREIAGEERIMPSCFIRTEAKTKEQMDEMLEYDLDEEDQIWIDHENRTKEKKKEKKMKLDLFERAIDRLEKETYFKSSGSVDVRSPIDNENLDEDCCICLNGDVDNMNQIIFCDMCNIAVHQECYGVPYIPEGQWLCRKCKMSPMENVKCELCPLRDGAFKPTSDGRWAHVMCAIWLNEVHFGNTAFLEPIEGVANSLRRRQKLRCLVCKVKGGGCLQCSKGSCVKAFHVTCAAEAGLQMTVNTHEDERQPDGLDVKRFVYCHNHGSTTIGENEFTKNKKKAIRKIKEARSKIANNSCRASATNIPCIDQEAKTKIQEIAGEYTDEILRFWYYKRKKRCGIPLIRRLQVKKKAVARVQTPMGETIRKGRIMYEKARMLIEMVKKREKNSRDLVMAESSVTLSLYQPIERILEEFITAMYKLDYHAFFHSDPVKVLANYNDIIKKPMWLGKMRDNVRKGEYTNEKEIKDHMELIFKNALVYNAANEPVLIYTREFQSAFLKNYDDLKRYLKFIHEWREEFSLSGEEKLKEEVKEEEHPRLSRDKDTREEPVTNKRKRKVDEVKKEEVEEGETPMVKREKRVKERDKKEIKKEKETKNGKIDSPSVFSHFATDPQTISSSRRFSLDSFTPRLDSNSNKSSRRVLTRGSTQTSFTNYREINSVLSPEMNGMTSCDSAVESDMEISRPPPSDSATLSDPSNLQHGDIVKVGRLAGTIVGVSEARLERDPEIVRLTKSIEPNHLIVKTFSNNAVASYDSSAVTLLDFESDLCEGVEEARSYRRAIFTK